MSDGSFKQLIDGIAAWEERSSDAEFPPCSPALFLDRDGVLMEEAHFPKCAADVRLTQGAGEAVALVNQADIPVVLVTNQSGIGRGYFDWDAFVEVQNELLRQLALHGAHLDFIMACGYYGKGVAPFDVDNHPWRKPAPGMLLRASETLSIDLVSSHIIGDRMSDLSAGRAAGLKSGTIVRTGHGAAITNALTADDMKDWHDKGFDLGIEDTMAKAIHQWLENR
ncbi:HAD-IIIA family hydrolase [Ahrensia sp. R2A130]|uniref:D-glycero-alpha-D-manno-heptose-1,7-bisphosphate 7-phosphatase n=1 Tax=Ahrensia sp. R2A130 TaxID=744979 RepID=UPI0001E08C3B|nr:HAD-IIIA family hydrolase [Ahrensia sp. R2A130]EFL89545.1 D,D-heptose 1,7-bisphosphate phosphatase [Ahrensia sp. R2A130]